MQKRKEIPRQANKNKAIRKAREFIVNKIFAGCRLIPLPFMNNKAGFCLAGKRRVRYWRPRSTIFEKRPVADARTSIIRGTSDFVTVYDASVTPQTRIRWTLAHEIGHIV
jgi:hypothetical protein